MRRVSRTALTALAWLLAVPAALAGQAQPSAPAQWREVDRVVAVEGVVEAERQSVLAAQVAGRVVTLAVKAGDTVKAGQPLVQIDSRSAAQAEVASRSQVREAQANLANAKAKYERSRQLFAQKFISQAALDQAQAEYLAAEAQTASAVANAGQSATVRSYTTIAAPYDGVVAATDVEVGDMAMLGRPLVTVFDPRDLRVTATVPQAVLAKADLGAPVRIRVSAQDRDLVAAKVTVIPVADTRTHTTRVRLDLPPAPGLLPGQYARASLVTGRARALTVPASAILRRSEVTAVYVLDANGRAQLRQVRVGDTLDGEVEVLAGVRAGERVATDPIRAGIEASRADEPPS
jgi:RND family efflux transporter MFP subunit